MFDPIRLVPVLVGLGPNTCFTGQYGQSDIGRGEVQLLGFVVRGGGREMLANLEGAAVRGSGTLVILLSLIELAEQAQAQGQVSLKVGRAFAAVLAPVFAHWLSGFWSAAGPAVLVLGLLWSRDRMRVTLVIGAYLGGLLLICAVVAGRGNPALDLFGVSVPAFFQPLIVWAYTIKDTVFLLFFLGSVFKGYAFLVSGHSHGGVQACAG